MKKILLKLSTSISKLIFPLLAKLFIVFRINRRAINFLSDKSYSANNYYDFSKTIENLINNKKLIALDVGAQGGFNSDSFFSKKYENFFEPILVEPIIEEVTKLRKKNKFIIDKGLWSSKCNKKIYILGNRSGSSSMYKPDPSNFDMHDIKEKDYSLFNVTDSFEVECETLSDSLKKIGINNLDYLKIDTQGSELEILKGIKNYRPLMIRTEVQILSMYQEVPSWSKLVDLLYELDYIVCDWKSIGSHAARVPAEMDMLFIPDFNKEKGRDLINNNENKFVSLMLIFGQIKLLKILSKRNKFKFSHLLKNLDDRYFF